MNYTALIELVKAYSDRGDVDVTSNLDNFILMAETKINRLLRIMEMSTRATIPTVADQEYYSLPDDFAGMRDIELQADDVSTSGEYFAPNQINTVKNYVLNDCFYYTNIAQQLQIYPTQEDGGTIEIIYYQKVPNLNATDSTNWVTDDYPDLYLAGIMVEVESFVKNASGAALWEDRFDKAAALIVKADNDDRWSGAPLRVRVI